jgi:hypothetical protein
VTIGKAQFNIEPEGKKMRHRPLDRSYWAKQLLRPEAFLGGVALSVQPWLLGIRATLLGRSLAQAIPDRPLGTLKTLGMSFNVGTCSLIAFTLTLAAMISVSIFLLDSPVGARRRYLRILSGIGVLLLLALELATVGGLPGKVTAVLLAVALIVLDGICGIRHSLTPVRRKKRSDRPVKTRAQATARRTRRIPSPLA